MQYREFVKEQMAKMPANMMAKDKMKAIGKLWRESGHSKSSASEAKKPMKSKNAIKSVKGGNIFDDVVNGLQGVMHIAPLFGLGLEPKKSKGGAVAGSGLKKKMSLSEHRKRIEAIPLAIAAQLAKGI